MTKPNSKHKWWDFLQMCTCTLCSFLDVKSGWPIILLVWFCLICNETSDSSAKYGKSCTQFNVIPNRMSYFFLHKTQKGKFSRLYKLLFFPYSEIEWEQWTAVHFHCMEKYILDILLNISVASSTINISYFYTSFAITANFILTFYSNLKFCAKMLFVIYPVSEFRDLMLNILTKQLLF